MSTPSPAASSRTRREIRQRLGWPQVSPRTLYRRIRLEAIWRRPKLTARGDRTMTTMTRIVSQLADLPRRAVVLACGQSHLNLARMSRPGAWGRR